MNTAAKLGACGTVLSFSPWKKIAPAPGTGPGHQAGEPKRPGSSEAPSTALGMTWRSARGSVVNERAQQHGLELCQLHA